VLDGQVRIDDPGDARPVGPRWCRWCSEPAFRVVEVEPKRKIKDKRTGTFQVIPPLTAPACDPCYRRIEHRKERAA